jgi:hypothetical protein
MKRLFLLLALAPLFAGVSCKNNEDPANIDADLVSNSATAGDNKNTELPELTFQKSVHDFGKITQGERVRTEFKFTNTGKSNLIISDARGSCGCTVPDWPKEPIKPGGEGAVKVEFNSEGKSGLMEKTVTIVTNCEPATRVIRIKAEIIVAQSSNQ